MNLDRTMVLGVIPARGGSKGIVRKNLRTVHGKPLIAYAIECGLNCPSIDHLIVSTEDEEIAAIARQYGADVPFMRPTRLADDLAAMLPVLEHAVTEGERKYGKLIEALVLLDPTGPLRTASDVETCLEIMRNTEADAVISGNPAHRSPYFNMVVEDGEYVRLPLEAAVEIGRRQDSPPVYDLNTLVWIYSRRAIMEEKRRLPRKTRLYIVRDKRAVDIDGEDDLEILDFLMSNIDEKVESVELPS